MSESELRAPSVVDQAAIREVQAQLEGIDKRDWWLWGTALLMMSLLTVPVFLLAVPWFFKDFDWLQQLEMDNAVRGLLAVVILFDGYAIYQQILIKRLRRNLAAQLLTVTTLEQHADEFYRQAVQDSLTGLYNRRYADSRLQAEMSRAERLKHPLIVVLLDLNDFKPINDQYGHAAGDLVLTEFAQRLMRAVRGSDLPVRIGGDEFMVLLPECPAERVPIMLARVTGLQVTISGQKVPVEYSAGWAQYQDGETAEQLMERTDKALYAAKRKAKNELAERAGGPVSATRT